MQRMKMAMQCLVALAIFGGIVCVFWPTVNRTQLPQRRVCQSHLKQIALACKQYLQDYDERMPMISTGEQGWADSIQPYLKSWQVFQCPMEKEPPKPLSSDYFLNARVEGAPRNKIPFGGQTILLGEGVDNGATNSHFSELPLDWKTDNPSPAKRHLDGANYAFVDGHVKWLKPEKVSVQTPQESRSPIATFAVR